MERRFPFSALVLDVDGVVTDTRKHHLRAWKKVFDEILSTRGLSEFTPSDYERFVDGKPREDGIASFFNSRGISLEASEVRSIGDAKNEFYLGLLEEDPPKTYDDFLEAHTFWESQGLILIAVSSSKNARMILDRAGVASKFETIFDGTDALALKLRGKPAPDIFLQALKSNNLTPEDSALVEDSVAGISAGRSGNYKFVFGMSRQGQTASSVLYRSGADAVVSSLREVGILKNGLLNWTDFLARVGDREVALFVDFDGTLTDIVDDPKDAQLSESMRALLETCSKSFKVSVISGRDRVDVKQRVGIESVFYSGCHGLEISGPGCFHFEVEEVSKLLPRLEEATLLLTSKFSHISGVLIERKRYSTALHYRMVTGVPEERVEREALEALRGFGELRIKLGKKVIEILPNVNWDKSLAVEKISEILAIDPRLTVPIYIGDDTTDEDVFVAYRRKGICMKVCDDEYLKNAHYALASPREVHRFLELLAREFAGEQKRWKPGL